MPPEGGGGDETATNPRGKWRFSPTFRVVMRWRTKDAPDHAMLCRLATGYWPLTTGHCSRATDRHSPLATRHSPLPPDSLATVLPPSASPAGSGRAQALPHWLLPSTDRRIGNDRTGPDLDDRSLSIQYVTEPGDPFGQIKLFLPARRP